MIAKRRPRVAVVYHYFQHYRSAIFDTLCRSERYEYIFVADTENMYDSGVEPWQAPEGVCFQRARCLNLPFGFMWQRGVVNIAFRQDIDAIIFFGNAYYLATWASAILAKLRRKRVIFWTHGWLKPDRGMKGWVRRRFYSQADAVLVYGHFAKQIALQNGFPPERFHVVYNSLDYSRQRELRDKITEERLTQVRSELFGRPELPIVLCVTRFIPRRRLDWLLEAASKLRRDGHEMNILLVGEGSEEDNLRRMATRLDLPVCFYGPCYDEQRLAELNLISCVTAAPGMVGLSAIQSLAYGVPVITQDDPHSQMPEAEAVVPGQTGDTFRDGEVEDLARVLHKWTQSPAVDSATRAECHRMIDRFYNPAFQRAVIERALDAEPADDLFWQRQPIS